MFIIARRSIWFGGVASVVAGLAIVALPVAKVCGQTPSARRTPPAAAAAEMPAGKATGNDVDARLARIEEHLERLTREIEELHAIIGSTRQPSRSELPAPPERPQAGVRERQPAPPANMRLRDRWSSDDNRYQQGDISAARQRAQAAAIQRTDRANAAAQQQADQREADEFVRRSQPAPLPPGNTRSGLADKRDNKQPSPPNPADAKNAGDKKGGEKTGDSVPPAEGDEDTK